MFLYWNIEKDIRKSDVLWLWTGSYLESQYSKSSTWGIKKFHWIPCPSPANPHIHMYEFWVVVIPYWVVTFVSCVTLTGSKYIICVRLSSDCWNALTYGKVDDVILNHGLWFGVYSQSNFVTQFIGVMITAKLVTWVKSNNLKFEFDLSSLLLNISLRLSDGFGV